MPAGAGAAADGGAAKQCVDCHLDSQERLTFRDGTSIDLEVDFTAWQASPHGRELRCIDCHRRAARLPHAPTSFADLREFHIDSAETCQRCHYAYYAQNLDSTHRRHLEAGHPLAPTCVDCHGAHDVSAPTARLAIHRRCAGCHREVSEVYAQSVHGRHLVAGDNDDVPVCTDCHGTHTIANPHDPLFHAGSHTICARCHGDPERMAPYGLSTYVLTSYLEDFHGRSNQLYAQGAGRPDRPFATCTDCHGVHDTHAITGDRAAIRHRVATICRGCHEDVPEGFADAWLSHYQPTLASAPIVWTVRKSARLLLMLVLAGLALHFLLHLWALRSHSPLDDG